MAPGVRYSYRVHVSGNCINIEIEIAVGNGIEFCAFDVSACSG